LLKIKSESVNIKETGLRLQNLSIICILIYQKFNERPQILCNILCGRMARMDQRRWPYPVSMWDVRISERRKGHPKTRWADTLKKVAEGHWSRTAKNRRK